MSEVRDGGVWLGGYDIGPLLEQARAEERKAVEAEIGLNLNYLSKRDAVLAISKAVAEEREACARVADLLANKHESYPCKEVAVRIRERRQG